MISDVKKFLFIGVKEDLDLFFNRAQKKGMIEFIPKDEGRTAKMPRYIEELMAAIKIVKHYPTADRAYPDDSEALEAAKEIIMLHDKMERLSEELIHIREEIAKMTPLGQFSLDQVNLFENLSNKRLRFYSCKRGFKDHSDFPEELVFVTTDHELDYFIYVGNEKFEYAELIELHFTHSLDEWKEKKEHWKANIKECEVRLKKYAAYVDFLQKNLVTKLNHVHLEQAKKASEEQLKGHLFAIDGWVPVKKVDQLIELSQDLGVHFEEVMIEERDRKPTYMENQKLGAIGEDLVHIYDTPSYEDKDPSRWVLFAFIVFFAMIVADAGYGMIYLLIGIVLRVKFYAKAKGAFKRFIKLLLMLSSASVIYGVLTCSYFSIDVAPNNPLNRYSLLNYLTEKKAEYHMKVKDDVYEEWSGRYPKIKSALTPTQFLHDAVTTMQNKKVFVIIKEFNDNILMELSLIVGILHVSLSFLRNLRKCWAGIGWIAFMVGGYFYFPKMLNATSMLNFMEVVSKPSSHIIGFQLLVGGAAFASIASLIQNRLSGIGEIVTSIQIFADVLSYLRLYALGLASMILAATFNDMGSQVHWALGVLITVAGHSVNIILGIMAGVIHGLRLNFLEWYHYSFEGGGKIFSPLKVMKY